jgi:hypothetical protein
MKEGKGRDQDGEGRGRDKGGTRDGIDERPVRVVHCA